MGDVQLSVDDVRRYLKRVYEVSEGSPDVFISEEAVAKELGFENSKMARIVSDLKERGFVEGAGVYGPLIVITTLGVRQAKMW